MKKEQPLCSCLICKEVKTARGLLCHIDRAHLHTNQYSSGNHGKYKEIGDKLRIKTQTRLTLEQVEYDKDPTFCLNCKTKLEFSRKTNKFCSASCSAKFNNQKRTNSGWTLSDDSKLKIKSSLQKQSLKYKYVCENCQNGFETSRVKQTCCSRTCALELRNFIRRKSRSDLANYRADCSFKFSLNDYPDKFDFDLIEQFGWYKAKNHGDNPNGISRDHMISIRYGFDNNIDPNIMSHPANCKLVRHNENVSKGKNSSITLEELLERIEQWNNGIMGE